MKRLRDFLKPLNLANPSPTVWTLAMLVYFVDSAFSAVLFFMPFSVSVYLSIVIGLAFVPGFIYSLGQFTRVEEGRDPTTARVISVMSGCIVTFILFGFVLPSISNMARALGSEIPFYATLTYLGSIANRAAALLFGAGAVLIRRRGHKVIAEEPLSPNSQRRSLAWFFQVAGVLMVFLGLYLGLFHFIALEGFVLLVTGLILLPIGWLMRRLSRPKPSKPTNR